MRLVAYDPFVTPERARQMNVDVLELDDLLAVADFVTLHVAKTPDTVGMIGVEALKKVKPGIRIVNVARGGIVDEQALADAIEDGRVAGAAIDVFADEPTTESPLFGLPGVVVTPHLGASTREAQDKAGATIAEQVGLALAGDFVPFAVNVSAAEASETVRPFLPLAERLGGLFAALLPELPDELRVEYQGQLADYDTRILTLSVQKGFFGRLTDEPVSYVNAPAVAKEKGMAVHESKTSTTQDFVNLITLRGGGRAMGGTLAGLLAKPRIVMVDDHAVDVPPSDHMLVVRNDDSPGVIGFLGTVLGEAGVNIADMDVGQSPDGQAALMVLALSTEVPESVQDELRADARIKLVRSLG